MRKWYTRSGMGIKAHDIHGAYCCTACHDVLDGRVKSDFEAEWLELEHLRGIIQTQKIMIQEGVLRL